MEQQKQMVNDKDSDSLVQMVIFRLKLLKIIEKESEIGIIGLDQSIYSAMEKRDFVMKELAAKMREILSLRQQIDEVSAPSELIQYEHRFSELYTQIQEKHQRTRTHYGTYNALLEIKDLLQKETSLLNSIISQFQDAIASSAGRFKLIKSMEDILKGTQQKLEKVRHTLLEDEATRDAVVEKCSHTVAEQRQFSSLLSTFQEECAKNERLQTLISNQKLNLH